MDSVSGESTIYLPGERLLVVSDYIINKATISNADYDRVRFRNTPNHIIRDTLKKLKRCGCRPGIVEILHEGYRRSYGNDKLHNVLRDCLPDSVEALILQIKAEPKHDPHGAEITKFILSRPHIKILELIQWTPDMCAILLDAMYHHASEGYLDVEPIRSIALNRCNLNEAAMESLGLLIGEGHLLGLLISTNTYQSVFDALHPGLATPECRLTKLNIRGPGVAAEMIPPILPSTLQAFNVWIGMPMGFQGILRVVGWIDMIADECEHLNHLRIEASGPPGAGDLSSDFIQAMVESLDDEWRAQDGTWSIIIDAMERTEIGEKRLVNVYALALNLPVSGLARYYTNHVFNLPNQIELLELMGGMREIAYSMHDVRDLIHAPHFNAKLLICAVHHDLDTLRDLFLDVRKFTRITDLRIPARGYTGEAMYNDPCVSALRSKWFHALQCVLSPRYVPRLAGSGSLVAEVPWGDYAHSIAQALGWPIKNLYLLPYGPTPSWRPRPSQIGWDEVPSSGEEEEEEEDGTEGEDEGGY